MRILLVRPPVPQHTMGLKHVMICEPLELEYVAAGLAGHDVEILDLIVEGGFQERLRHFRPDVIGTSCYITGVNEVKKLCREAKRWNPRVWTVVGGVHASRAPEDFADHSVDCIVLGDGTTVMPELLQAIQAGTALEEVPGLALPVDDERVAFTPERPYMAQADDLPFPRRDLVAHLRHHYYYIFHRPLATMKTTWGCWYRCNFCFTWQITDGHPHSRSPESIVEELARIEEDEVYIVDDIFLINRRRLQRIAELIRARGIRKHYLCYGRSDFIAENEDVIAEWAELGLRAVLIGLEAATDAELDSMNKQNTVDHNSRAIEVLRRHGVDTYGSLIPDPEYGPEEWERLWRFIEDNGLYYLNISPLTPLPGTSIWAEYQDRITVPRKAHGLWDLSHAVLPTRMPLKAFYRSLLGVYSRAIMDIRRADRLTLRTRPPVWSRAYLRIWWGCLRIWLQFRRAHRHHTPEALAEAMDRGPAVPGLRRRLRLGTGTTAERPSARLRSDAQAPAFRPVPDRFSGFFGEDPWRPPPRGALLDHSPALQWLELIDDTCRRDRYTFQAPLEGRAGSRAQVDGREMLLLSSYDYLGLLGDPRVQRGAMDAIERHGTGTGGVRLLTGTAVLHRELEEEIAHFKGTEAALVFSSGYVANLGAIAALFGPRDRIVADERIHRSLIDACRMAHVPLQRFAHGDPEALDAELRRARRHRRTLVVVEGIYSMDGDVCPLPEIVEVKNRHGAYLMVDEAHSFGALGATGRGVDEHHGVPTDEVDLWMGSLSKAIPAVGGFLAGSRELMVYLQHGAASFMFSAAVSPAAAGAALSALRILREEPERLRRLHRNADRLRRGLQSLGYDTGASESAIVPVLCTDRDEAFRLSRALYRQEVLASAVIPPAVPSEGCRVRLCATAAMADLELREALAAFRRVRSASDGAVGRPQGLPRRRLAVLGEAET